MKTKMFLMVLMGMTLIGTRVLTQDAPPPEQQPEETQAIVVEEVDAAIQSEAEPVPAGETDAAIEPEVEPIDTAEAAPAAAPAGEGENFIAVLEPEGAALSADNENLINLTLEDVPLEDVVKMFTRMANANIIASTSNLEGTVTVNLVDVEWRPALSSILDMHNLALTEKTPGSGVYSIVPKSPDAPEQMLTKAFALKYTTASDISPIIQNMLPEGASMTLFPSRNIIVVKSTSENLTDIKNIIEQIDQPTKQVCIETKFMELNDEAVQQLGIKWSSLEEFGVRLNAGPFESLQSIAKNKQQNDTIHRWNNKNTTDDTDEYYDMYGEQFEQSTVSWVESPPESGIWSGTTVITPTRTRNDTLDYGLDVDRNVVNNFTKQITERQAAILSLDTMNVILSALKKTDGVSIVSNPKLIVTSGDRDAVFRIGQKEPIIKTEISRGTADSPGDVVTAKLDTEVSTESIKGGYINTGIDLQVIPVVKTDELIEATIAPRLTRKLGDKRVGDNSWPIMSVKEIKTTFTLRSGQTVAIGGLTDTTDEKRTSKIPILGSLPLLGKYLFSHTKDVQSQVETIIFVGLTLAEPTELYAEVGIPEDSELVHKKMIRQDLRRHEFRSDLETIRESAEAEKADRTKKVRARLRKRHK